MSLIHPSSVIDPSAQLAADAEVGPLCFVGPHVKIGAGTRLLSHVVVSGHTTIGSGNTIHPNAVLGGPPQDLKWRGEATQLIVGDNNSIRENVTLNTGTVQDRLSGGVTRLGSGNLLMANSHIGHDCQIGDGNIIANNVMIAGHVHLGNRVVLLGGAGCHHFVTIGDYAYVAGLARIRHDIPPFVKVQEEGRMVALNKLGLKRAGYPDTAIAELESVVRQLVKRGRPTAVTIRRFHLDNGIHPDVRKLVQFIERRSGVKNGRYLESLRGR